MTVFAKIAVIGAITIASAASLANEPTVVPLEDRVDALFAAYDQADNPGYAIGIVNDGKLVFARGYGAADIESGTPITPQTAFNLASVSKQFTAAAVAREIQSGSIRLNDKLSEHWSDLPDAFADIEIGHLIYMTSGLPEYYSLPSPKGGWESEDRFTVDDAIETVLGTERLEYTPGSRWTYSNINYQILAEVAASKRDMGFSEYMANSFFEPLSMSQTWVDAPIQADRSGRAVSYVWDDSGQGWRVAPRMSPHYGGSGMFSSLEDLAKWDAALFSEKSLGKDFTQTMLSTQRYDHDKVNDAFGLVHGSYRGQPTIWYEGGDYGVSTYMARLPDRDQTIICLSNIGNGGCYSKATAVLDVLLAFDEDADFVAD